jgi:hypothetical protein
MIERDEAEKIKSVALDCVRQLDMSVKLALADAPEDQSSIYRRLVGQAMGHIFTEVLMPVYAAYPDLEPEELKKARHLGATKRMPLEVGLQLMATCTAVEGALKELGAEMAHAQGESESSFEERLREPLTFLRDTRKFLWHACPDISAS